ncbi:hypothetical protein MRX96_038718 [Rhipicephalus microplus]
MSSFPSIAVSVTCIKLLFITAYRSTDFEVHRNWLAITHSLPTSKWYFEKTSEWTLDYPPLFAWFEYVLSLAAQFVDPGMLEIANLNYASPATIYFQRLTVILSDLVLIYAVWVWQGLISPAKRDRSSKHDDPWLDKTTVLSMLFLWNPGLLLVDHVHFQYNGFLHGILLLATARLFQGRCVEATLWFTVLLNLKHIYLYVAPVFFVYLLRNYCFTQPSGKARQSFLQRFKLVNFLRLAGAVLLVFAVSLWPFLSKAQLMQMLQRLFPFKRGLCHAYWAPNWWALYAAVDRVLAFTGIGSGKTAMTIASPTSGLVQDTNFALLPNVPPLSTFILTALFQLPALWGLWKRPQEPWLLAILMPVLLATPLALCSSSDAAVYVILSAAGHASLFPLLFQSAEMPAKVLLVLLHTVYAVCTLGKLHSSKADQKRRYASFTQVTRHAGTLLTWFERAGLCVLGPGSGRSWQLWFLQPSRDA